jgi:hypothetical protein
MSFRHLKRFGERMAIPIPSDEDGLTGRECPNPECLGYFKIEFGTGLKGKNLPCHCPYCGHTADHDTFWTPEQLEYAQSIALNTIQKALRQDMREWDRQLKRQTRNSFLKLRVEYKGHPHPIRYYREKELETNVVCEQCTLHYAIYGVFGYCPDCGVHNSRQILDKNLELARKELTIAQESGDDEEFSAYLIADALENAVSAFDGFGRESCKVTAVKAANPDQAERISFQNLSRADDRLQKLFGFRLSDGLSSDEWDFVFKCFQKRHLLAHKMGVVDEAYISASGDTDAVVGRKIVIRANEVNELIQHLHTMGQHLITQLATT